MSDKPEQRMFYPKNVASTSHGTLIEGTDGIVLYRTRNTDDGSLTTVAIGSTDEQIEHFAITLLQLLMNREDTKQDFTPADQDFHAILNSLKSGPKH